MTSDTTLIQGLRLSNGSYSPAARLYYYQGNFYWPFLSLDGSEAGKIKRAIRQFLRKNRSQVQVDRSSPNYKNLLELFDEQMGGVL